jgi:hypothetical protein
VWRCSAENKLFSDEYGYFLVDMEDMSVIGETEEQYTYFTHDSGVELVRYDGEREAILAGTVAYGEGGSFSSELYDIAADGGEAMTISGGVISTENSLYNITEDDRMVEFKGAAAPHADCWPTIFSPACSSVKAISTTLSFSIYSLLQVTTGSPEACI